MKNYSVNLPNYSIGEKVYEKIPEICCEYGNKAIVIGGKKGMEAAKKDLLAAVSHENPTKQDIQIIDFLFYGGEASYENVEKLMQNEKVKEADMIFAVGGGKAIDTGKCLSVKLDKPIFTFPTIASNCAATTSVAIMYHPNGVFKEPFFFSKPAEHAFIQTTILANAPVRYMWAGMGDTYAKYYESTVSARGEELPHFYQLGMTVSEMCKTPILQYGEQAMKDNASNETSDAFEQVVLAIVVTTGVASILLTSEHKIDYNTGLAHAIFYALTAFPQIEERHLHGEVVGFGVLLLLLCDGQKEEFERLYQFHKKVNLPVTIEDIEISGEELNEVIPKIVMMPDIKHWPYQVTESMLESAFQKLATM